VRRRLCQRGNFNPKPLEKNMKWATRDHVHMDRVASPWLIKRFIDPEAEFVFLPFGKEHPIPDDVIPFAIPGVKIGPQADGIWEAN
jgi:hypothetical protein